MAKVGQICLPKVGLAKAGLSRPHMHPRSDAHGRPRSFSHLIPPVWSCFGGLLFLRTVAPVCGSVTLLRAPGALFRVQGSGFRVQGVVWGVGCVGCGVWGVGCGVWGVGVLGVQDAQLAHSGQ